MNRAGRRAHRACRTARATSPVAIVRTHGGRILNAYTARVERTKDLDAVVLVIDLGHARIGEVGIDVTSVSQADAVAFVRRARFQPEAVVQLRSPLPDAVVLVVVAAVELTVIDVPLVPEPPATCDPAAGWPTGR